MGGVCLAKLDKYGDGDHSNYIGQHIVVRQPANPIAAIGWHNLVEHSMNDVSVAVAVASAALHAAKAAKPESVAAIVRDILKADKTLSKRAMQLYGEGVFSDTLTDAQKGRKEEYREELYKQLAKDAGGIAAKGAAMTQGQWAELCEVDRKEYQAARTRVKEAVDNRWSRLKKAAEKGLVEKAAAERAAALGEVAGKAAGDASHETKNLLERFASFEVSICSANKSKKIIIKKVEPAKLDALCKAFRDGLEAALKESSL